MGYSHHSGVRLSSLTEPIKKFSAIMEPTIHHHFHKRPALDIFPQSSSHPHNPIPLRFILILFSSLSQFSNDHFLVGFKPKFYMQLYPHVNPLPASTSGDLYKSQLPHCISTLSNHLSEHFNVGHFVITRVFSIC